MVEKLSKALEGLKNIQFTTSPEDSNVSKKEKMFFCVLAADVMVSLKVKNMHNLPVVIENMINLCDDKDSDVRMVADESLNRIIMSLSQSNILKVLIELHNVIKKNGPARCLRAALVRFGQLAHYIRPNKGRAHVQMLVPALIEIAKRQEESIHETLASSMENIFKVLGVFVQDNVLKSLLKAFLHNLSSSNPVIRRCAASSIIAAVQYCRKPTVFNSFILNSLLDCVVPIWEETSTDLILGVLGCLRLLLPTLIGAKNEEGISGSFGLRRRQEESLLSVDRLIQAYELCLHYTKSKDHNVVAAALETLNQILQTPPHQLVSFFLSPAGFSRSYIHAGKENRLWSRSGSEMSVTCSLPPLDDAALLDESEQFSGLFSTDHFDDKPTSKLKGLGQSDDDFKLIESPLREKLSEKSGSMSNQFTLDVDSDTESVATSDSNVPTNFLMRIDTEEKQEEEVELEYSSNSQDDLYSPSESDRLWGVPNLIDVGSFTDTAVPLIYCARHLTASFLLDGTPNSLKSDRAVRVSIKSLALSCISAIIKLYPVIMKMTLGKNQIDSCAQEMNDILLYRDHCDPQIRGNVNVLVGCFIHSALCESKGFESDWLSEANSKVGCQYLLTILLQGLRDKSSVCTRQALAGFKTCINSGLFSVYNSMFLELLDDLIAVTCNSYWLVKVKLAEVIADLPYVCICDLTNSKVYQEEIIDSVLFPLLGDEDGRVRQAAAEALVRVVPFLYNGKSTVLEYGKSFTDHLNKWLKVKKDSTTNFLPCVPFSAIYVDRDEIRYSEKTEYSLSKIVSKLTFALLVPKNKHFLFGYIEALNLLSQKYPTTVYTQGWNCGKPQTETGEHVLTSTLITNVLSLLVTSPNMLDLTAFSNATLLLGNLFAGISVSYLKTNYEVSANPTTEEQVKWGAFKREQVSQLAEAILTHLLKILNFYCHLVEEVTVSSVAESSTAVNTFLPLLSPIKKEKKTEEKAEDKKSKNVTNYKQSTQYTKLQRLLKNAYTNYKVSLDITVGDKFLNLLESTLYTLSVLLEVATVQESGRFAEEILSYFRSVVSLRPNPTIICVIQLLKSVFGTNLASNWEESKLPTLNFQGVNLFDSFYHVPIELLSEKIRRRANSNAFDCENLSGCKKRTDRKIVIKNSDKNWLASYIRLFEPMVVRSLQLYTISGDVTIQANVLRLLNQLVLLRVNYCLLDEEQVFLDFVLKQFDLIERGQIPGVESLLPHIFKFLIFLSYEKQHSKSIMSVPKILQLCDGLMASDQSVETHCIPALIPVVEDVFLSRSLVEEKELETQRDVLLSMLLRLVEFPTVMDMLAVILNESKTVEEKERWKRWSRQVIDALLPLVGQDKLRIETLEGQNSFTRLMSSLSPNVLRPIDPILKALVVEPTNYDCPTSLKRWLSKVSVLLETVLFVKEDALLNRLEEINPNINLATFSSSGTLGLSDPFNVKNFFQTYESSETAARFIFKVVSLVGCKILEIKSYQLEEQLSRFFICVFHILKSGTFHRITNSLQTLLAKEADSMTAIYSMFYKMSHQFPALTCQFSYLLTLLSYTEEDYWIKVLTKRNTLSAKLVQSCGVIALSDYLCDNLSDSDTLHFLLKNNISELVLLSHEIPIRELLITIHRKKSDWTYFLKIISSKNFEDVDVAFTEKLLRLLEITESSHSSTLLVLLINKFLGSPSLALSLLASSIACRQVEHLLMLTKEKVLEQIDVEEFIKFVDIFKDEKYLKRHSTLWGLLNKLGLQVFDLSDLSKSLTDLDINNVSLDENWYFDQVKQRCRKRGSIGDEVPTLISRLSYEKIEEIMSTSDFNLKFLKDCLLYPEALRQKYQLQDSDAKQRDSASSLFKAAKACLFRNLNEIWKELQKMRNGGSGNEIHSRFWDIASCLTVFMELTYSGDLVLGKEHLDKIAGFWTWCLKLIVREKKTSGETYPKNLVSGLNCCWTVLRSRQITSLLCEPVMRDDLENCVRSVFSIVTGLIPNCRLSKVLQEKSPTAESEQLEFLLSFITTKTNDALLPCYLMDGIRNVVVHLCRIPVLSSHVLKVPESYEMQDLDLLKNFIARFSVVGWSSRQHFEEIWVALLSVLGFNTQGDVPAEETGFVVQAIAAAVEGITTLLKNTLLDFRTKKLIHHGRDSLSMKNVYEKLPIIPNVYKNDQFSDRTYHFLDNLEISLRDDRYTYGLLSVEYLWTAVNQITSQVDLYEKHSADLNAMGLDLPSCIYLLLELYNQWIYQASPDIKIITSSLKSSIVVSDLFTDISQFQWLLNFCFRVDELIIPEDTVILPLIILGSCKAGAIVLPNEEICEKIKKLMIRSNDAACRIAATQGLLYLLQSYVVCYAVNHTSLPPPGSTFQRDEANFVACIVDTFLPVAIQFIQEFKIQFEGAVDEYNRCNWALVFYLLQHYQSSLGDLKEEFLNLIINTLCSKNCSSSVMSLLIRGTERLLLTTVTDESFRDQLSKVSLEIISSNSPTRARNGLQLLIVLSFLDKRVKDIRQLVTGMDDPEKVMKDMEKINILFDKLKKSYPKEAEVVGGVISYILMDFSASDVLTKVIQEFLSSQQPHQKILAGLLFKVFERAEQSLLEDWVVFSLPSFIQGLPIAMSIWTLNCFFVSASNEPWLRSLFPLVQSRIRMAEAEDKKLLCLSANHFYNQLKDESQKKSFKQTFEKASTIDSVYSDLLASLR